MTKELQIWAVIALQVFYIRIMGYGLGGVMAPRSTQRSQRQPAFLVRCIASLGRWLVYKGAKLLSHSTSARSTQLLMGTQIRTWVIRYGFI